MLNIPIIRLIDDAIIPIYAKPGDAGADLVAVESVVLDPGGGRALISTGVAVAIPEGFAGFVQPRSGLALKHGITCLNTPGLIDSGYRGELKVLLINTDPNFFLNISSAIAIPTAFPRPCPKGPVVVSIPVFFLYSG